MNKSIRLHAAVSDHSSQRLNAFPGRNLSEHAFDLMQVHIDQRIDPLLGNGYPGILEGLQLRSHHAGKQLQLHVQPGTAVGADGRAIRVFFPIELDWEALLNAHRHANADPEVRLHGLYFLTVRRMVGRVEDSPQARPCTRNQVDPLRDSRVETYATLDLQYITSLQSLMDMSQQRAVNRLCVRFLNEPIFDLDSGAVPLAIACIDNDTPQWIDTLGGHFLAQPDAAYHAFAAHWEGVLQALTEAQPEPVAKKALSLAGNILSRRRTATLTGNPGVVDLAGIRHPLFGALQPADSLEVSEMPLKEVSALSNTLRDLLGVDYMPAAGRFPDTLLGDIAGHQTGETAEDWALPELLFDARDLQVEMLPVPASTAFGVIHRELPRGALDLVHYQGDRLRIMVAVEDRDYRPDLMDLPEVDLDLIDDLFERAQNAIETEHDWATAHRELYNNLDSGLVVDGEITDEALALLKNTYLVAGYSITGSPDYPALDEDQREQLGIPAAIGNALKPAQFFADLSKQGSSRPYTNTIPTPPDGYDLPTFEPSTEDGLYRQSADLATQIEQLEESLEQGHDLIDELNDFLSIQRQHLDAITTNFAALAGGVAGDGSGLRLMRWNGALNFIADTTPPTSEDKTGIK